MPFTKPSITYNSIAKEVQGIKVISRTSLALLKAAYSNELDNAAKILANYRWFGTRDITMILITAALLVLAEKNEDDLSKPLPAELTDQLKLTDKNLFEAFENQQTTIKNLFIAMAKGDGPKAELYAKGSLEGIFKSIILKKENYKKADTQWDWYTKQLRKIKPWKYSSDALKNNVIQVLASTLQPQYGNVFIKAVSTTSKEYNNILKIMEKVKSKPLPLVGNVYPYFMGFVNDRNPANYLCSIKHDQFTVYYEYENKVSVVYAYDEQKDSPSILYNIFLYFDKSEENEIAYYLTKQKISTVDNFKKFLTDTVEADLQKLQNSINKKETKKNFAKIVWDKLKQPKYSTSIHPIYSEGEFKSQIKDSEDVYHKIQTSPFVIAINLHTNSIYCCAESIAEYLTEQNITEKSKIEEELNKYLKAVLEKINVLEQLPKKLKEEINAPKGYSCEFKICDELKSGGAEDIITTKNGLRVSYSYDKYKPEIGINFDKREILGKMNDLPQNIINALKDSANEILSLVSVEQQAATILMQINATNKEKALEKTSLKLSDITMMDSKVTGEEPETIVDDIKVWYKIHHQYYDPTNKISIVLHRPTVLQKLTKKSYTGEQQIKEYLEELVKNVFDKLSKKLSGEYPQKPEPTSDDKPRPKTVGTIVRDKLDELGIRDSFYKGKESQLSDPKKYYTIRKDTPTIVAINLLTNSISCSADSIEKYFIQQKITQEQSIRYTLIDWFNSAIQRSQVLKDLPEKLQKEIKAPEGYSCKFSPISSPLQFKPTITTNGLSIWHSTSKDKVITIFFDKREILDKMKDNSGDIIINTLKDSVNKIIGFISVQQQAEPIVEQINKENKGNKLEGTSLDISDIVMRDTHLFADEPETIVDDITVWYKTLTNKISIVLHRPTVFQKLKENNYTGKQQIKEYLEEFVKNVFDKLSEELSVNFPPKKGSDNE